MRVFRWPCLYFCLSLSALCSAYSGGAGTQADPYLITTPSDVLELGSSPEDYTRWFKLTRDIDLGQHVSRDALIAPDRDPEKDRHQGTVFAGVFDGNGHRILNMRIKDYSDTKDFLGLFGKLGKQAKVTNLGIVAGTEPAIILDKNSYYIGTLAGYNEGEISCCYVDCDIIADKHIFSCGGLVGYNSGTIRDCYALGEISLDNITSSIGGLVGYNSGTIQHSFAVCQISVGTHSLTLGGLVGGSWSTGNTIQSFWDSEATRLYKSGGGSSRSTREMQSRSNYNGWSGAVWTLDEGGDYPHLAWEAAPGEPIATVMERSYAGRGTLEDPYRLATGEDMSQFCQRLEDWNDVFLIVADINLASIEDYNPPRDFKGVIDGNNHTISNLRFEREETNVGLIGSLGIGGEISHLHLKDVQIAGKSQTGMLVGFNQGTITHCSARGTIRHLGGMNLGGLVGKNDRTGFIVDCSAFPYIYGNSRLDDGSTWVSTVGGLVGSNGGTIETSSAYPHIMGDYALGGLIGYQGQRAVTRDCYAQGYISSRIGNVGGLIGDNELGTIERCYAVVEIYMTESGQTAGGLTAVGTSMASFWDTEVSGIDAGSDGIGLSTANMKRMSTFVNAGWEFGDDDHVGVWTMPETYGYPILLWER